MNFNERYRKINITILTIAISRANKLQSTSVSKTEVNNNQAVSLKIFPTDIPQTATTLRSCQLRTGSSTLFDQEFFIFRQSSETCWCLKLSVLSIFDLSNLN